MKRTEKEQIIAEVTETVGRARGLFFTDFSGLTVEQATELRREFRKAGIDYRVVKNTLLKLAAQGLPAEQLVVGLEGPTALAYTEGDPVNVAKTLTGFIREFKLPHIKGGLADGHVLGAEQIQALATMPPRPVLIAQVVGGLQGPVASFVGTMQQLYSGIVYTLQGVVDKKKQ